MLAVFAIPEAKLFVQCSECDGFVKLSDVGYTDYEDAVCAHSLSSRNDAAILGPHVVW